jgi:hypothetical protein
MLAGLSSLVGEEQRAAVAQSAIAVGVSVVEDGVHAQSNGAKRSTIGFKDGRGASIERDSGDATTTSHRVVDVPCIIGSIGSDMSRELRVWQRRLADRVDESR